MFGVAYAYLGWFSPKASEQERANWKAQGEAVQVLEATAPGYRTVPAAD
jgi:Na+:H+ antiporter, NhaC family